MKGSREQKRKTAKWRKYLRAVHWDSLAVFKWERCKKWRGKKRRPRDGSHGTAAAYIER